MSELRAGGLALVIGGDPSLIGYTVTTELLVMPGQTFSRPDGGLARNDVIRPKWLCTDERITVQLADKSHSDGWGLFWIEHLLPIDGKSEHEDDQQKELTYG